MKLERIDLALIAFSSVCVMISVIGVVYFQSKQQAKTVSGGGPVAIGSTSKPDCAPGYHFDYDRGCFKPSIVAEPGVGVKGIAVGKSTPDDVLRVFGSDCKVNRHSDGKVYGISYDYDGSGKYDASRAANHVRPHGFDFKDGVLQTISIGVYQQDIALPGGLSSASTKADMLSELGDHFDFVPTKPLEKYIYRDKGVEVWITEADATVNSFIIRIPQSRE